MSASTSWSSAISAAFMAFNRSGRFEGDPGDALVRVVDLQCVHGGSLRSARPYPATHGMARAAGPPAGTGAEHGSAVLERRRRSGGRGLRLARAARERCLASSRRGSRSRSRRSASLDDGQAVLQLPGRVRWVAQHSDDDPPHRFVDELVSLPLHWRHTHTFEAMGDSTTRVDRPRRHARPGLLPPADLPLPAPAARRRPGGAPERWNRRAASDGRRHGLLGPRRLGPLRVSLHRRASRRPPGAPLATMTRRAGLGTRSGPTRGALEGVDAVVHLAGASIAGRFTAVHKRLVRDSRVGPTAALARVMAACPTGRACSCARRRSATTGPTGGRGAHARTAAAGSGFLAELVEDWEAAAQPAPPPACESCTCGRASCSPPAGPASSSFARCSRPGSADPSRRVAVGLVDRCSTTCSMSSGARSPTTSSVGPLNAVRPTPVTNREYAATLARVMRRPALLPVPAFGPQLLLGAEGAHEMVQASQRVARPDSRSGHVFRHPALEAVCATSSGHSTRRSRARNWGARLDQAGALARRGAATPLGVR